MTSFNLAILLLIAASFQPAHLDACWQDEPSPGVASQSVPGPVDELAQKSEGNQILEQLAKWRTMFFELELVDRLSSSEALREQVRVSETDAARFQEWRNEALITTNRTGNYVEPLSSYFDRVKTSLSRSSQEEVRRLAAYMHAGQLIEDSQNYYENSFLVVRASVFVVMSRHRLEPQVERSIDDVVNVSRDLTARLRLAQDKIREELMKELIRGFPDEQGLARGMLSDVISARIPFVDAETREERTMQVTRELFKLREGPTPIETALCRELFELTELQERELERRLTELIFRHQRIIDEIGIPGAINYSVLPKEWRDEIYARPNVPLTEEQELANSKRAEQYRISFSRIVDEILLPHQKQLAQIVVRQSELWDESEDDPTAPFWWPAKMKDELGLTEAEVNHLEQAATDAAENYNQRIDEIAEESSEELLRVVPQELQEEIRDIVENYESAPDLGRDSYFFDFREAAGIEAGPESDFEDND